MIHHELLKFHLSFLHLAVVFVHFACEGVAEGFQLFVRADGFYLVEREKKGVAIGDVDATLPADDATDMDAKEGSEVKIFEQMSCPCAVLWDFEETDVNVAIQEMMGINRFFVSQNDGFNLLGTQVLDEEAFHLDASLFETA